MQVLSGAAVIVVASEGLVQVDDREARSAGGDCEGDSNKCEDFFHGRILSKRQLELYHTPTGICDRKLRKITCYAGVNSDGSGIAIRTERLTDGEKQWRLSAVVRSHPPKVLRTGLPARSELTRYFKRPIPHAFLGRVSHLSRARVRPG